MRASLRIAVLVLAVIAGAVGCGGDDDRAEPASTVPPAEAGTLRWLEASEPPAGQVSAVTTIDGGFLVATNTPEGVEFWRSEDGDIWTMVAGGGDAFGPEVAVIGLEQGAAGYVAEVEWRGEGETMLAPTSVWTSPDAVTWHRVDPEAELVEVGSPYLSMVAEVDTAEAGPGGFVALGSRDIDVDLAAIVADHAPDHVGEEIWAVSTELRPEGPVLLLGFGEPEGDDLVAVPFEDLGLGPEDYVPEGEPTGELLMWRSSDGTTWESVDVAFLATDLPPGSGGHRLVGTDDAVLLFAPRPEKPTGSAGPGVTEGFESSDGRTWTRFSVQGQPKDSPFPMLWMLDGVEVANGLFISSGSDGTAPGLWTSPDARTWTRQPDEPLFAFGDSSVSLEEIQGGGAGFVATGVLEGADETTGPQPTITKDGYEVTIGPLLVVVADGATGDTIAEIDPEVGASDTVEIMEDDRGLHFVDTVTGQTLVTLTHAEVDAAFEAELEELDVELPVPVVRYSTDLERWTLDADADLFGADRHVISSAVGDEAAVAVVATVGLQEIEDPRDVPANQIWVGTPNR